MNDPAEQDTSTPEAPPSPVLDPPPLTEDTWLLHYSGTEPLTRGAYTWQPDQVVSVPEAIARTLFGSDNLRVVQDPELREALANRPNP